MARRTWQQLPAAVRTAIERETGTVARVESPSAGRNSDFSATLHTDDGPVFCKAIADAEGPRGHMHRREVVVNPWLPTAVAPRLRWHAKADGWLVLGFEQVAGRHADLSPGSADLDDVAGTVTTLAASLSHCPAEVPRLAEQWDRLSAWSRIPEAHVDGWAADNLDELCAWEAQGIELADGDHLVHTDLHPYNILVEAGRARVVDWAWSRRGAAAVDVAFLVARLVAAGHTPESAERWANDLPVWRATRPTARTALAVAIWGIWAYKDSEQPGPLWDRLVPAVRELALHRLRVTARG